MPAGEPPKVASRLWPVAAVDPHWRKSCRPTDWLQGTHDRDRGPAVWLDKTQMQLHVRLTTDLNSNAGCVRCRWRKPSV
jgi:hypothetical protein